MQDIELINRLKSLENQLGRRPQKRDSITLNYWARKRFRSWNNFMKASGYVVYYYQKVASTSVNEKFGYFLGLLITDGHIRYSKSKDYKVALYTSYDDEKELIVELIMNLFNYKPAITKRKYGFNKRDNYEVRISSKKLAEELMTKFQIPHDPKSLKVKIPEIIKNADIEIKKAFIRGVIDGDGCILRDSVKITSGSIDFLNGMIELLKEFEIHSGKITKDRKTGMAFSIRICKHQDRLKVKEMYNSSEWCYKRKKEKIDKI